jgi:hypothetical protein
MGAGIIPTERLTKLKIKLLESDLPAYKIAGIIGMHPSTLSEYALGQKTMTIPHLRVLTKYFKCRQQDILGWDEIEWIVEDA